MRMEINEAPIAPLMDCAGFDGLLRGKREARLRSAAVENKIRDIFAKRGTVLESVA